MQKCDNEESLQPTRRDDGYYVGSYNALPDFAYDLGCYAGSCSALLERQTQFCRQ